MSFKQRHQWTSQAMLMGVSTVLASLPVASWAQIIPDTTLPTNSQVAPDCINCTINGGTERGVNLYHSFREFSIPTGGSAWFNNAPQIQNILTRVTGSNPSTIDGLIRANGTANLFLLNPNGIQFGANAALQIGGSLIASTSDRVWFPDGSEFSATNPQAPPLLTVNITPGLQYGTPVGNLSHSGNLAVNAGQSLTLHGNTVMSSGTLTAPGGQVQVLGDRVALIDNAQVNVSAPGGGGTVLIGGDFQGNGTVPNASRTFVGPNVEIKADAIATGNGGRVIVWSDEATRFYGTISARGGEASGNGGFVEISGKENLEFNGQVDVGAVRGNPGTVLFDPRDINIVALLGFDNAQLGDSAILFADGGAADFQISALALAGIPTGTITLQATRDINFNASVNLSPGVNLTAEAGNNITFQGGFSLFGIPGVITNGGTVNLRSGADVILDNFILRTDRFLGGSPGDIIITTGANGRLILQNQGVLLTDTRGAEPAGNITIQAGAVNISPPIGTGGISGISANSFGSGDAGQIRINTGRLAIDRSAIQAFSNSAGNAGAIIVQANQVEIDGQGDLTRGAGLFALTNSTASTGRSGVITVDTQSLVMRDGGGIYAGTVSASPGGSITVRASDIDLTGVGRLPSTLSVGSLTQFGATGDAGTMQITTDRLTVRNGAVIDGNAFLGQAGSLNIQATGVNLDAGTIAAEGQRGGNVVLDTAQLQVNNASFISVATLLGDVGERLLIRATDRVSVQNGSSISTSSLSGQAGDLRIETPNLAIQNLSTVSSSTVGDGVAGNVTIRSPNRNIGTLTIEGASFLVASPSGAVSSGNLLVETGTITVNAGGLSTGVIGQGQGGNMNIRASNLTVQNSGFIATSVFGQGQGGNLTIAVDNAIRLSDRATVSTSAFGGGSGGNLAVSARQLDISNQSSINTVSFDQVNSPARTNIFADLQLDVIQSSPFLSNLFRFIDNSGASGVQGNAGELTVQVTDTITIGNRSSLATVGAGRTNGANLSVQTADLNLVDGGGLLSGISGQGRGGNINVQANNLRSQNGLISSQGLDFGTAANINLVLTNTLNSDGGQILASSDRSGGGDITITARDIRLRNGSLFSTSVFDSTGGGGNITVRSNVFIALEDSDILANAEFGPGGNIFINSPAFLADFFATGRATAVGRNPGSFARFRGNGRVDISAESRSGTSGTVEFPDLDLNRGLTPLNVDLVDPSQLIAQTCIPKGLERTGSFTVTGRGGLPPTPDGVLQDETILTDWVTVSDATEDRDRAMPTNQSSHPSTKSPASSTSPNPPHTIVEANSWTQAQDGTVSLVATAAIATPTWAGLPSLNCDQ
ncbi:MAG: filamentous hemagglutinin N-terminal domain-containing protein [Leptolyngbyaceae cyanobacterium bins.349]|nr:filamentous hemagglutinin N-terminal domain-containing protein [Leptolyngbyaceae cyanobacterium bins.349]